jgi:hypothetical protein
MDLKIYSSESHPKHAKLSGCVHARKAGYPNPDPRQKKNINNVW